MHCWAQPFHKVGRLVPDVCGPAPDHHRAFGRNSEVSNGWHNFVDREPEVIAQTIHRFHRRLLTAGLDVGDRSTLEIEDASERILTDTRRLRFPNRADALADFRVKLIEIQHRRSGPSKSEYSQHPPDVNVIDRLAGLVRPAIVVSSLLTCQFH